MTESVIETEIHLYYITAIMTTDRPAFTTPWPTAQTVSKASSSSAWT